MLEPAGGAGAGVVSTKAFVAVPQPIASIGGPPTDRRTKLPPVAAIPAVYVASATVAYVPTALAMSRWRPGPRSISVVQPTRRVALAPVADAYASSRPSRSIGAAPALVISTYSSEAPAPPVTTSAIRSPGDTGQATAGAWWPAAGGDPEAGATVRARVATDHARTNAARAARRARTIDDLPAGIRAAGLRCSGCLLPAAHLEVNRD